MNPLFNLERTDIEKYVCIKEWKNKPITVIFYDIKVYDIVYAYFDLQTWGDTTYSIIIKDGYYTKTIDYIPPQKFNEHFILFSEHRKNKIQKLLKAS